jgi:hypothetical protein
MSFDIPAGSPGEPVPVPHGMREEILRAEISRTPLRTQVNCVDESGQSICGTLQSKNRHEVELVNCICQEVIPGPDGEKQAKYSHVPWQAIKISCLTHFVDLSDMQGKSSRRDSIDDISRSSVKGILLMNGRLRPSPKLVDLKDSHDSPENIQNAITVARRGSEVCIVDEWNRSHQGLFVSSGPDGVELMNCVFIETIPGLKEQTQCKTSYVAFESFAPESIQSFKVISEPVPGFVLPDTDDGCEEYCLDQFVYVDGRRQKRGYAPKLEPSRSEERSRADD